MRLTPYIWIVFLTLLIFPFMLGCGTPHQQSPDYPLQAVTNDWSGTVVLRVLVGKNCRPYSVEVTQSSGHKILDDTAKECVVKWKFRPNQIGTNTIPFSFIISSIKH